MEKHTKTNSFTSLSSLGFNILGSRSDELHPRTEVLSQKMFSLDQKLEILAQAQNPMHLS